MRKDGIQLFPLTWKELEPIMLSEVSKKDKEKHQIISFIHGVLRNKERD